MQPQQATLKFTQRKIYTLPWAWVYTLLLSSPIASSMRLLKSHSECKNPAAFSCQEGNVGIDVCTPTSRINWVRWHMEQRGVRGEWGVWPISISLLLRHGEMWLRFPAILMAPWTQGSLSETHCQAGARIWGGFWQKNERGTQNIVVFQVYFHCNL